MIPPVRLGIGIGFLKIINEVVDRACLLIELTSTKRPAQEIGKIFRAVAGQVKHSFEKQVLEKVLSSDVEDKGIPRPDLGDVSEVLVRPHAEVDSALDAQFSELGYRM